jgi:hypothetical protein
MYAMSFVNPTARQWGVAKVNKAARELFADKSIILSPSDPDLPIWLVQQMLSDVRQSFGSKVSHEVAGTCPAQHDGE